jgi:hypothetical protein
MVPAGNEDFGDWRLRRVTLDGTNLFGLGTDNKYLSIYFSRLAGSGGTSTNGPVLYTATGRSGYGSSGEVSLRFYDPGVATGSVAFSRILIRLSTSSGQPSNANSPFALGISKGQIYKIANSRMAMGDSIGTYALRMAHNLTFVFNNTNADIGYDGGRHIVSKGTMDIWLNGQLLESGVAMLGSIPVNAAMKSIAINAIAAPTTAITMNFDDISLSSSITISSIPVN